jgi:hypothetical protein
MKKIYLSISAVALALCSLAQESSFIKPAAKQAFVPKTAVKSTIKNKKVSTASFQGRFDPSYSLPSSHAFDMTTDYGTYVDPIYCDTTTKSSFASVATITDHFFGVSFDPKSIIFDPSFLPLVDPADAYYLDTVWIAGVYQRRGNFVDDTLIVNIVWGDTANTNVFASWAYASAPMSTWGKYKTPKYSTTAGVNGDKIKYSAASTNKLTFKHILTKADSTYLADVSDYLPILVNGATGQLIPNDNIVNCGFSFNAGGTHANGDVSWASSTAGTPGTVSGWAAVEYAQDVPAVAALTDITNGYDDYGTGKNYPTFISKAGRYGQESGTFLTATRAAYYWGYWIDFSIHYDASSVKVNELERTGFSLNQNIPNPFTKESTVKYTLAKDASSAVFTVTDVMGRIISSEKVGATTGTHSVKLGAYAAGLYYYSLNVDGNVTSKKMIVE